MSDFAVVVPVYNESARLDETLEALAVQSDTDFLLVLVDNGSTDDSRVRANAFRLRHPELSVELVDEPEKGTGAASDSGFRRAIALGACWIARTDADCLPDRHWVRNIKRAFCDRGLEFVAGKIKPRTDDIPLRISDRCLIPVVLCIAENFGKIYRRGQRFQYPYILVAGNNLAISARLYIRAGGFPRTCIEDEHEDRVLAENVRMLTRRAAVCPDVIVYNSIRRARRYGYLRTLLWYWGHKYRPVVVDVR